MKNDQILEIVIKKLPYSNQIEKLDIWPGIGFIKFSWRDIRFRVDKNLMVEEVRGGILASSNVAMLLEAILKK